MCYAKKNANADAGEWDAARVAAGLTDDSYLCTAVLSREVVRFLVRPVAYCYSLSDNGFAIPSICLSLSLSLTGSLSRARSLALLSLTYVGRTTRTFPAHSPQFRSRFRLHIGADAAVAHTATA